MANANIDALYVGSFRIKNHISFPSNFIFNKWCVTKVTHCMFFLSCVCYAFVRVCLYVPCGHLLGKG